MGLRILSYVLLEVSADSQEIMHLHIRNSDIEEALKHSPSYLKAHGLGLVSIDNSGAR